MKNQPLILPIKEDEFNKVKQGKNLEKHYHLKNGKTVFVVISNKLLSQDEVEALLEKGFDVCPVTLEKIEDYSRIDNKDKVVMQGYKESPYQVFIISERLANLQGIKETKQSAKLDSSKSQERK
jgi:citrate lyase beta subunit